MHESRSTPRLPADSAWWPAHWSVRTKISVVLLLPVLVAVALAEIRIQGELDRATALSAARDRLPVLRDTVDLTASLGEEMVAAVAVPAGAPDTLTAAVDAKVAAIQRDSGFSPLPADTGRAVNTALGKLAGIRAAGAGGGDVRTKAAGYNDIITTLGDLVPALVPADAGTEAAAGAETARLLVHLRAELATEGTYARAAQTSPDDASLRPAVVQTAAEQEVLGEQAEHQLSGDLLNRLKAATSSAEGRLDALQNPGNSGGAALASFVPSITAETTGVTGVLNDVATKLAGDVSAAADRARSDSLRDTALVLGALLGALAIALLVVRSLVTPVRRLRAAALRAANEQLPETVRQVREGHDIDWRAVPDSGIKTEEEIGQLAHAFDDMHRQAVRLAVEQAELRKQVSEMFMTLSRRSQSLVEQQLSIIEDLEAGEQNPRRLDELFRIDHIATRLRRNGENLHVLAGGRPVRHGREPVPTRDLLRAATSEVKDYRRVAMGNAPRSSVQPEAAADVVHILAELLENATRFSPPEHKVALTADRGADGGLLIEVVDQGLGMTPAELTAVNDRLAAAGTVGPETTRRMGLFVVGRLAALHGVTVRLRATGTGARHAGVTASVHVPGALVIADLARPIGAGRLATAGTGRNGHTRPPVVPEQASTPIFEQVVTSWFTEPVAKPLPRRDVPVEWPPPATNGRATRSEAPADPVGWPPAADESAVAADRAGQNGTTAAHRAPLADPAESTSQPASPAEAAASSGAEPAPTTADWPTSAETPAARPEKTAAPVGEWDTPADRTRQAAESALKPSIAQRLTDAGLPTRRPGAQLAPGAVVPRVREQTGGAFRDAAAVRTSLSRHYQGMRAARRETAARAEESGKDEVDPR
ncbi:ATP-binding protein [Amycolatopsis mongoliensis]|uniref:histidine kinase n=1 Tax=Amycolatopsis mongoliensis TaxID=715475 RepID=A0A9Y2JHK5_9PSEU|nr:ATP-binding protein [Amycolatopsis sp. 4-36]WIX98765.1 ATP-binding protein [Amycolatopsis sp. 4-36]